MGIFSFLADRAGYGRVKDAKALAEQLKAEGEEQKRSLILEAREENQKLRESAENELRERRQELQKQEGRFTQREESLERKMQSLEQEENALSDRSKSIDAAKEEAEKLKEQQLHQLQSLAGLTSSEAKEIILKKAEGRGSV